MDFTTPYICQKLHPPPISHHKGRSTQISLPQLFSIDQLQTLNLYPMNTIQPLPLFIYSQLPISTTKKKRKRNPLFVPFSNPLMQLLIVEQYKFPNALSPP